VNSSLEWRRSKVSELSSQGYNQSEISRILQISQPTINRDIAYLRQQAKENIKRYIGLTVITKEAWSTAQNTEDKREKTIQPTISSPLVLFPSLLRKNICPEVHHVLY
jgi:transcriptional regulator